MASTDEGSIILDYTARDFDSIRSLLVGIAKGKFPEWVTVGEANDFGTLLIELYAYLGDTTNFYIDRVSSEAFLGTAQRRQSVLYMAEMLGYRPLSQKAAIVSLTFTLDPAFGDGTLVIPAGTVVQAGAVNETTGTQFETDYTITLSSPDNLTADVTATEGRTVNQFVGTSKGTPNMTFATNDQGVIGGSMKVRTLEGRSTSGLTVSPQYVTWQEVPSVAAARPVQSVYSTYTDDQNYSHVVFGDNSAGRIPPIGAEIEISYRYGLGAGANGLDSNTLVTITSPGLPLEFLKVTNKASPVGGSDPESVQSMRFSIPRARQVRGRAVTIDDFNSLSLQVPGVAKAVAYGQVYSAVNIRIAPVGGLPTTELMTELRRQVTDYLADKVLIGAKVFVEDVQWTDIYININLNVLDGFNRANTESGVYSAVQNLLAFDNMDFGKSVSLGEVYREAMKVDGVDYVDIVGYNTTSLDDTGTSSRITPTFDTILRIHPAGVDPEADPLGVLITSTGGVE